MHDMCWLRFESILPIVTKWGDFVSGGGDFFLGDLNCCCVVLLTVPVAPPLNIFFYGLPQNQISRLQHIQNTAARVVTLSRKSCHITPILKELHWLPVSQRIVFKLMLIVYKSVNNIAPIYISELLKVYTPSRNLRSSNMSLLKEPTSKRTWGDRSFSVAAPRLWNHLPTKVKSCHSITRFKSLLKTHLMSQFFKDDVYL